MSYIWSRNADDFTGYNLAGINRLSNVTGPQNTYALHAERSLSAQDVPNRFTGDGDI